jgi:hypothetical protein
MLDIFKSDYGIATLRDKIFADFYRDTDYENMEVWKSEPSHDTQSVTGGWALSEGQLVRGANVGNVDDYLKVTRGDELSMYDANAATLLDRLPEGITTRVSRPCYPEGLILSGSSITKEEKNVLRWTNIYEFESAEDVRSADAEKYFRVSRTASKRRQALSPSAAKSALLTRSPSNMTASSSPGAC